MRRLITNQLITRNNWRTDVYYVDAETGETFVTPDGVGAYFYESLEEAMEDYDADRVWVLHTKPDLDLNPDF